MRTTRLLAATAALLVVACDFHVTNPGPVQDDFLDLAAAYPAIVNGAGRNLSDALNWISYTGAAVARELNPAGSTGRLSSMSSSGSEVLDRMVTPTPARTNCATAL